MIPIRCFTCGKVVGNKWERYKQMTNKDDCEMDTVFKELCIERWCCKRMLLSHVDLTDKMINYDKPEAYLKMYTPQ
jgi:DNA-directed RNA polymerase I, II, and III subunit RPABC5